MQQKLTQILNNILGIGMHRRTTTSPLPMSGKRIWEVRSRAHRRPVKSSRAA